ncbi:2-polyprenyl-3-methyl-5-hydroxy-6-metoxy-1, 4-benzoquinol methylase [Methylocella tundrae]|uniref:2-polyprenyl-3-methyl-5-hydroxy-6-metoxy-1, 4-benzoquinol methylase n=2 Tax=Methylocella tundrae TaxID=227605 RepID=A0A4U8Z1T7_METTU|nr:2-polyprenyl-3-methyl-5-hydroxy-6-metoxy-1, 4-benzoquinol methylase [Methylocella tundrae]
MNSPTFPTDFEGRKPDEADAAKAVPCPCCGGGSTTALYHVPSIPVHSCVLLNSAEEARAFPRRDLQLAFCDSCGFLFNQIFDEGVMSYSGNFEESQHFSDTFSAFAKELAREIAQACSAHGKHVLEIGCGKGEFLRELCRISSATGLGIDPGYRTDAGRDEEDDRVQFITDFYKPSGQFDADIILCRHTLEHIASVQKFVRSIREGIGSRTDPWVVFETPDAKRVLAEGAFWDIYYEHCSYFSPGAHARLFRAEGFDVTDLRLRYGDQYIVQYARPISTGLSRPHLDLEDDLAEMQGLAKSFPSRVRIVQDEWRERVRSASAEGKRIVVWGGGSKGVSFLTTLGLDTEISAVVDVNPYKQGKFMPGAGHRVIAPSALVAEPPDLVIVMNPIYVAEITKTLNALGLKPEISAVG